MDTITLSNLYLMQCCFHKQLIVFGREKEANEKLKVIEQIREMKDLYGEETTVRFDPHTKEVHFPLKETHGG